MKLETIIKEIDRISNIEDPKTCQIEIKELNRMIKIPRITKRKRGSYYYMYSVLEYRYDREIGHSRENKLKKLGRISIQNYESNKKKIEELIKSRDQEGLKKYLESY